ncbi:hypothetical protein [Maricaulis sp. MIT060901]|uniref:hypothetical protein n=1 Tax=Maricaulis sp. MIT060901 TaxID=3096993 RepID=UPI00399B8990
MSTTTTSNARPQDEMLPFLNNFHDIFTTIGVVILLVGMNMGIAQVLDTYDFGEGQNLVYARLGLFAGVALVAWLLSALLVGRQRRILPGIVLAATFGITTSGVLGWLYTDYLINGVGIAQLMQEGGEFQISGDQFSFAAVSAVIENLNPVVRFAPIVYAMIGLLPMVAYYLAFRLPFTGGLVGAGLVFTAAMVIVAVLPYYAILYLPGLLLLAATTLLVAGILFDARDPQRRTRLSGTAFWLHFFAAPAMLFAVLTVTQAGFSLDMVEVMNPQQIFIFSAMSEDNVSSTTVAATALTVIGIFAIISLLINRRALIVSGLLTAGVSISVIVNESGMGEGATIAVTMLVLGGIVVVLGAAWNPVRSILLAPFPSEGPLARIFPPVSHNEG